ncbi:MAG: 5-(carboxyamino)imidazole ribonucleotide synthase [Alphaproteobacteria bacterium]|nr:5-(carboxyamino)imidazole ribonucleotide synthase [Alphaproteobacteria bacterium]
MTKSALPEGAVIGILGGGQLGRMTAIAAAELGYRAHIFAPQGDAPACDMAYASTRADYDDLDQLNAFGAAVDTVTSEFENVPAEVMATLATHAPVSPGVAALSTAQHRIKEKTLARDLGIMVPDFAAITSAGDMAPAMARMANGAVLKTCRLGYDGKGQARLKAGDTGEEAFASLGSDDCILEEMVDFSAEASFLVARNAQGEVSAFPASINHHEDGILATSRAPADPAVLPPALLKDGQDAVAAIAEALDLVGVLAAEMFITPKGLVFNEIAPRPHNSFHWTIEGTKTSQFAQLVRAITGLPFGSTEAMGQWQMDNILGQHMDRLNNAIGEDGVFVHRYGKAEAKPGRKMAHLTRKV